LENVIQKAETKKKTADERVSILLNAANKQRVKTFCICDRSTWFSLRMVQNEYFI